MTKLLWLACATLAVGANFAFATTYMYTGPVYVTATGLYTTSMKIAGTFTTASPLPTNMALTNIGPNGGSNLVTSWSFSDGVNSYTNANSVLIYEDPSDFAVATDASGGISAWNLGFMAPDPPNTVDEPMNGIFFTGAVTQATTAAPCSTVTAGVCESIPTGTANYATADTAGIWQTETAVKVTSVPTLSESALILLGIGMATLAVLVRRRRIG